MSPSILNRITTFARSPQGRRLTAQAKQLARDPATKRKIDEARQRVMRRNKPR